MINISFEFTAEMIKLWRTSFKQTNMNIIIRSRHIETIEEKSKYYLTEINKLYYKKVILVRFINKISTEIK